MSYDEITLWRRFMDGKGVLNNFEYLYRSHRFDNRDFEKYLEDVEPEDVILSAFDFTGAGNSIFGYRYWKEMDAKWQKRLAEWRETGIMDEGALVLCPHCGRTLPKTAFRLNRQGKPHKHCRECESGDWDRRIREKKEALKEEMRLERLRKEVGDRAAELDVLTKVCVHCGQRKMKSEFGHSDATEDGLQSYCKECQRELAEAADAVQAQPPVTTYGPQLGEYDATLHYKDHKSITLNAAITAIIRERGLTKCYLNTDRERRLFLIFNTEEGANLTSAAPGDRLLRVNSAEYIRIIADRFGLAAGNSYYLHITKNLSHAGGFVTVEILSVRTKEAFMAGTNDEPQTEVAEEEPVSPELPAAVLPPAELLQQLLDEGHITERDMAVCLSQRGWKLQEPVTTYKKFIV